MKGTTWPWSWGEEFKLAVGSGSGQEGFKVQSSRLKREIGGGTGQEGFKVQCSANWD